MGRKNATDSERKDLLSRYGIEYFQHRPRISRFGNTFDEIQELGETYLDSYDANLNKEKREKPWRAAIFDQAVTISHKARLLCSEDIGEETGRYDLEHKIFDRFDVEVTW
jgi:hypothetical protein